MEKDINSMSIEEIEKLQNELESRKNAIKEQEMKKKRKIVKEKIDGLEQYRDIILSLLNHSRTSCSDDHISNGYIDSLGYAKCSKCHLIEIFNGYYDNGEFDVSFDVTITQVR
ncbi:hypothetical protein [Paenibacillus cremeus]|uniref:Uncharacterized protein n=1 Tax=Paenibacillus cremeus TaxID=2163881 RepID=A0A559KCN0_9BACL|nr:hypothetical protein [Paenibacillus cremeus]TVY09888.1 hypothetical protein FPZ49_10980 [Paenibacillus cremeus]